MTVLFADSDSDVTKADAEKYGARLISMPYSIDGTTIYPYEDFEEFDAGTFYTMLRNGVMPTTSAISEEKYISYFESVFAAGNDILYVHFSPAMSTTFNAMNKALETLKEKYPEREFHEIDTKGISIISYAIFCDVARMLKEGKSVQEILDWAKTEVDHYAMYFFAEDLKFFKRSGRVSGLAATIGTVVGIRAIIYMSPDGKMESIGKERGRIKAIDRLITALEELGDDAVHHKIYIAHTDIPEVVDMLLEELREKYGNNLDIEIKLVNPTAGCHCGPDGIGICFRSIHR